MVRTCWLTSQHFSGHGHGTKHRLHWKCATQTGSTNRTRVRSPPFSSVLVSDGCYWTRARFMRVRTTPNSARSDASQKFLFNLSSPLHSALCASSVIQTGSAIGLTWKNGENVSMVGCVKEHRSFSSFIVQSRLSRQAQRASSNRFSNNEEFLCRHCRGT